MWSVSKRNEMNGGGGGDDHQDPTRIMIVFQLGNTEIELRWVQNHSVSTLEQKLRIEIPLDLAVISVDLTG